MNYERDYQAGYAVGEFAYYGMHSRDDGSETPESIALRIWPENKQWMSKLNLRAVREGFIAAYKNNEKNK